ncbi:MAG: hypothetical protein ACI9JY_000558 [Saprospiraceae bacterium]|jgi:hypothetical protein
MIITLLSTSQIMVSQNCPAFINAEVVFDSEAFSSGCAPISYCFNIQLLGNEPFEGAVLSLERPPNVTSNIEWLVPINLNGFMQNANGEYSGTFTIPPSASGTQFCIDFIVDENQGGSPIKTDFVLTLPNPCTNQATLYKQIAAPVPPQIVGNGGIIELLSDLINQPFGLFPPAQAANNTQKILNKGTLVIDIAEEYILPNGSRMRMAEDAKIIVQEGSHLTLRGGSTFVKGCFAMWNSIEVESGATLTIENGARISDALRAIDAKAGSTINIVDVTFNNNQVGVYASDGTDTNWTVEGNTFQSDELLPPFAGQIGRAGIELYNATQFIAFDNDFLNLANGILGNGSNLYIFGGSFKDMRTDNNISPNGYGIRAFGNGHFLLQAGKGKDLDNPTFDNCRDAIFTLGYNTFARDNGIIDVNKGVRVWAAKNMAVDIRENIISARDVGIDLFRNQPLSANSTVAENDIIMNGSLNRSVGIKVKEFPVGNGIRIEDNRIELQRAMFGIDVSGASNMTMRGNGIRLENKAFMRGMNVEGSTDLAITCNRVSSTINDLTSQRYGLYATSLPNSNIECNSFENLRFGINMYDMNDNTFLKGNSFENYFNGLLYGQYPNDGNAILESQSHHGNSWGGALTDVAGAVHMSDNFNVITGARFFIDTGDNNDFLPPNIELGTPNYTDPLPVNWFFPDSGDSYVCPSSSFCPDLSNEGWIPSELDENIIDNPVFSGDYAEAQAWKAQSHLYRRLQKHPQWLDSDLGFDGFVNQNEGSAIDGLSNFGHQLNTAYTPADIITDEQANGATTLSTKMNDLAVILENTNGNVNENPTIQSILTDMIVAQNSLSNAYQNQLMVLDSELSNLQGNLDVSVPTIYEKNALIVNTIYLETLNASDENMYSSSQAAELKSIAFQCPLSGGDAVYIARGMLGMTSNFDNSAMCNSSQNSVAPLVNNTTVAATTFSAYPNPASDKLTVTFEEGLSVNGEISIVNIVGQIVKSFKITEGEISMDISLESVDNGIYLLQLRTDNQPIQATTIKVVK